MAILGLLGTAACGVATNAGAAPGDSDAPSVCQASSECPTGWTCNEFHSCEPPGEGREPEPPPETEIAVGAPISGDRYVYVAMTAQGRVARIDGATLAVTSLAVGAAPREVATIPDSDGAVVLDSESGSATVVRPVTTGGDGTRVLATLRGLNRIAIDPSGRFAVIWFDLLKARVDHTAETGSFQDVAVVGLARGQERSVALTVGFRPRAVQFAASGDRAYVITEDGVSVIDLADAVARGPYLVPPIAVADASVPAGDLEVQVVATGEYAAVRQAGRSGLRVVGLGAARGQVWDVPLASPPTDIDLAPDGARIYAVERDTARLSVIDVPADAIDPSGVETVALAPAQIGSFAVSPDGTRGIAYTNAALDPHVTVIALDAPGFPHATFALAKAVRAVGIAPDSASAIVLAAKAPGDPATANSVEEYIARSHGYAVLDLATGFAKLQLTPVDPGPFTYAPDGATAYVALDGGDAAGAVRAAQVVEARTGIIRTLALGSPPSAVGIVPGARQAFVAQRHPLGRMSFVALATGALRTVTGFDLNGQIVDK